jgi:nucleoside-diphosphate-sugar epimerase
MKILVTGGAGYIGSVLVPMLLERGDRVRCLDSLRFSEIQPLLPLFRRPQFEFVLGDVRDEDTVRRCLADVDAVIHLAAVVGYPACNRNPDLAREVNTDATRLLARLRSPQQPILFASTGSNYGAVGGDVLCKEDTPLRPLSLYGSTKTEAETLLLDVGNVMVYRLATAFGISPQLRLDLLVNDFCFRAVRDRNMILYEADARRTFIHVHDVARAFLHALDNYATVRGNVYNCGDSSLNATKRRIVELIQERTDFYVHVADVGRDEDQRDYLVNYDRLGATGFCTTVTLSAGIQEMLVAFRLLRMSAPFSRANA